MSQIPLKKNVEKFKLEACDLCGSWDASQPYECTGSNNRQGYHYVYGMSHKASHIKIGGQWYAMSGDYIDKVAALVEIEDSLRVAGALVDPDPLRIDNLTELFTFLRKAGVGEEALKKVFPVSQVVRMRGRVLKKLVA